MITHEEVVLLVESNPNDMKLGSKIRQLYWYDRDKPYRHEDNMPDLKDIKLHGMGDITEEPAYRERNESQIRHEEKIFGATTNNPKGTSVTSPNPDLDEQMEEAHSILEDENRFPGTKKTDYTIHGYDANGSPVEEEIDITSAYTKNPHPRTGI